MSLLLPDPMSGQATPQAPVVPPRTDDEWSRRLQLKETPLPPLAELPAAELLALKQRLLNTTKALRSELTAERQKANEHAPAWRHGAEEAVVAEHAARMDAERCRLGAMQAEERLASCRVAAAEEKRQATNSNEFERRERCTAPAFQEATAAHAYFLQEWISVRTGLADARCKCKKSEESAALEIREERECRAELENEQAELSQLEASLQQELQRPAEERRKAEEMALERKNRAAKDEARARQEVEKLTAETQARGKEMMDRLRAELTRISRENEENQIHDSISHYESEIWQDDSALKILSRSSMFSHDDAPSTTTVETPGTIVHQPFSHRSMPTLEKKLSVVQFLEQRTTRKAASINSPTTQPNAIRSSSADKLSPTAVQKKMPGTPSAIVTAVSPSTVKSSTANAGNEAKGEPKQSPRPEAPPPSRHEEAIVATDPEAGTRSTKSTHTAKSKEHDLKEQHDPDTSKQHRKTDKKPKDQDTKEQHDTDTFRLRSQSTINSFPSLQSERQRTRTTFALQPTEKLEIQIDATKSDVSGENSWRISEVGSLPRSTLATPVNDDGVSDVVSEYCPSEVTEVTQTSNAPPNKQFRTEEPGSPLSAATSTSQSFAKRIRSHFSSGKKSASVSSDGARVRAQTTSESLGRSKATLIDKKQSDYSLRAKSLNPAPIGSERRNWWPRFGGQQKSDAFNLTANLSPSTMQPTSPEQSTSEASSSGGGLILGIRRRR